MVLDGKVAFITGGSRGLGKAVAALFAREGAKVAIAARDSARLEAAAGELRQAGACVLPLTLDVRSESEVDAAFARVRESLGPVDILVNAAGVSLIRKLVDTSLEEWAGVIDANLTGPFLTCRAAVRQMIEHQRRGRIINVSSTMGKTGSPMGSAYSASKAALVGFTQSLGKELVSSGIRVNAVCPGAMDTDMMRRDTLGVLAELYHTSEEALLKSTVSAIPIRRLIAPDEVAGIVLLLARDDVDFLVGQAINVSGGYEVH